MTDLTSLILMNFCIVANSSPLTQCYWKLSLPTYEILYDRCHWVKRYWILHLQKLTNCPLKCLHWLIIKVWINFQEFSQLYKLFTELCRGKPNISDQGTVTYLTNTTKRYLLLTLFGFILSLNCSPTSGNFTSVLTLPWFSAGKFCCSFN